MATVTDTVMVMVTVMGTFTVTLSLARSRTPSSYDGYFVCIKLRIMLRFSPNLASTAGLDTEPVLGVMVAMGKLDMHATISVPSAVLMCFMYFSVLVA